VDNSPVQQAFGRWVEVPVLHGNVNVYAHVTSAAFVQAGSGMTQARLRSARPTNTSSQKSPTFN